MENKKLNRWYLAGIFIIVVLILSETKKTITNKDISEKIDFVWQDNGNAFDEIKEKIDTLGSKIDDLESKINDLEWELLLKE